MPGIRTSMMITSGLRRSAISTADAPSEASPTTRIWGALESERRRPSRTTSWSSTIRAVISSAIGRTIVRSKKRKLFGAGGGTRPDGAAVANLVPPRERADEVTRRTRDRGRQVRTACVQLLVARQELRPVAFEAAQEVLTRAGLQVEQVCPDAARTGFAGRED